MISQSSSKWVYQGFCLWCFLLKVQSGGQAAQAAANDRDVEDFARILCYLRRIGENVVTNLVAGCHHFEGVSIRLGVVARAAVTGEAFFSQLSQQLVRREPAQQGVARGKEGGIHEIPAGDLAIHAEDRIVSLLFRLFSHRAAGFSPVPPGKRLIPVIQILQRNRRLPGCRDR